MCDTLASIWSVYKCAKVNFFLGNVSPWNSLPDAVDGKDTPGVSLTFHLSTDCVGTACCSASLDYPLANKKIPLSISLISN